MVFVGAVPDRKWCIWVMNPARIRFTVPVTYKETIMSKFYSLVVAFVVCVLCVAMVKAEEATQTPVVAPTPVVDVDAVAAEIAEKAKADFMSAYARQQEKSAAAAARASRSWSQFGKDAGTAVYGTARYGVLMAGAGLSNADGYVSSAVAVPSAYAANAAFSLGASASAAAK